ncbi:L-aminoadipate-semialdehyde dehydrogenase-phosphopantetheinyl transferase isoform X1 [Ricinus communis]|nr:L-aminoadipate-semialdehyde dehydrogenase-phosphopantetheinyl transferase isoform X1 [Ricinus communis]|eukprot:XP_015578332.1 L-aminoadipate-semialdehyde dehydrogenase-phosphopantetheinyl transferase [Ricinus communis]
MEKGVQRWIVDISKWDPSPHEFSLALFLLPQHHHSSITRFVKMEDRKRALVSRLLQYALILEVLGIPYDEIVIKRTLEGKPYLECAKVYSEFPNFNFNVSHHGDFVAIASEPVCIVGVDVVCCVEPQNETITEFIHSFNSYFSSLEWNTIINSGTSDEILVEFYRYWCLKEAFVKARGSGLVNGLNKVEFHHTNWTNIFVKIDGKPVKEWRFWLFELQNRHLVSVAKGHPKEAVDSYKRTISQLDFDEVEYHKGLYLPSVRFVERTIEQLIQFSHGAVNILKQKIKS